MRVCSACGKPLKPMTQLSTGGRIYVCKKPTCKKYGKGQ